MQQCNASKNSEGDAKWWRKKCVCVCVCVCVWKPTADEVIVLPVFWQQVMCELQAGNDPDNADW